MQQSTTEMFYVSDFNREICKLREQLSVMQHSSEIFGNRFLLDSFVPNNSFSLKLPKQNNN